ncbi:nucleotidyltransferase [Flavobacterium panacagri]|uniref:nucleotidyltransferase n=1 Tax=Flavobacterium panacagri TaxID=3034146 RepID=UPI0025A58662|nr:nucleotidyltransferase [Flavobacterium panacagri]
MARSISEIQKEMVDAISKSQNLSGELTLITSTSKASIARLLTFIVATAIWTLEVFFDQHTKEIDEKLANQKSGTLPWYRTMALRFQEGFDLVTDRDYFENGDAEAQEIEDSKIIKYAAVAESAEASRVIIKIAGETDQKLSPITQDQKASFEAYMKEIKWAGVEVTVINYKPDKLRLEIQIKRDALVLNNKGMSIKNANYPVEEALLEHMKELPFDGDLRLSAIVDKLQKVPGVLDATIKSASSAWINPDLNDYDQPQPILISTVPVSGYFEIETFENIEYVV